jgi:hypothetical protein
MGFLRRNPNGTTGYNFLKNSCVSQDSDINQDVQEKSVTIGNLYDGLQPNSYSTTSFADDRKNKSKPCKLQTCTSNQIIKIYLYLEI